MAFQPSLCYSLWYLHLSLARQTQWASRGFFIVCSSKGKINEEHAPGNKISTNFFFNERISFECKDTFCEEYTQHLLLQYVSSNHQNIWNCNFLYIYFIITFNCEPVSNVWWKIWIQNWYPCLKLIKVFIVCLKGQRLIKKHTSCWLLKR